MKKFTLMFLVTCFAMTTAQADPIYGIWQTIGDDNGNYGHIEIKDCDGTICGVLIKSFNSSGKQIESPNVGKKLIWDMQANGDGKYGGGKAWSPDRDKTYSSKLALVGDNLTVTGCVLIFCRDGGTWIRTK